MALENILEKQPNMPNQLDVEYADTSQLDLQDNPLDALSIFNTQALEIENADQRYEQQLTTQETTDDPYKKIEFQSKGPTPELIEQDKQISAAKDIKELRTLQKKLDDNFKNNGGFRKYAVEATNPFRAGRAYEFDVYSSNYRRYKAYGDETFNKLGFNPLLNDNEDYYNRNTTYWQDWVRSTGQWGKLFKPAFTANYRSIMNFFSGDDKYDILAPDLKGAAEFEDALNIGMSSKKGFRAGVTNFNLQMMYTYGIAANVVAEEIAIWAGGLLLSPFTGGGSLAGSAAASTVTVGKAAANVNRFKRSWQSLRTGLKATQFGAGATMIGGGWQMLKSFKDINNARKFWTGVKAGAITTTKGTLNFVNPLRATTGLMLDVRAGTVGWKNMTNFAKATRSLGAFYRDTRENMFAVSEAQLEGGTVYLNTLNTLIDEHRAKNNGEMPTGDTLKGMYETAEAAGRWQTLTNIPIIFFSNRFVFDGLFNFKGVSNTVADQLTKKSKPIGNYQWDLTSRSFAQNSKTFLQRSKAGLKTFPAFFWNYTKANFAEGIQENLQETSGAAITNYYVNTFKDPSLAGSDYLKSQIYRAADENIFSKQGMEIFLNGFLMGGPMRATTKAATWSLNKISDLYLQNKLGKQGYADYVANKAKTEQETVDVLNNIINDPDTFFGRKRESLVNQKNGNFQMSQAEIDENDKLYYDAKDAKTLDQIHTSLENGTFPLLIDALKDMSTLSDKELAEAFNIDDGQLARQKLEGYIENANKIKDKYDLFDRKHPNPFDPAKYKKAKKPADFNLSVDYLSDKITAKEYLEKMDQELSETEEDNIDYAKYLANQVIKDNPEHQAYIKEVIAYKAFEDAKKTAIFAEHAFGRAIDRFESVLNDLVNDKLVAKASSADYVILISTDNISKEIDLLKREMSTFDADTATKEQKKIQRDKERKRDALIEYQKNLKNYLDNKVDDTVDENGNIIIGDNTELLAPLEKSFEEYVQAIANINSDDFVVYFKAPKSFQRLVDLYKLDEDAKRFLGVVNTLTIPENLYRYADAINNSLTNVYKNATFLVSKGVKDYLRIQEFAELVGMLHKIGVRISSEDIEPLLFDNVIPRTFYDDRNDKIIDASDSRYEFARVSVIRFINIQRTERGEEIIEEEQTAEQQAPEEQAPPVQPTIQVVPPTVVAQEPEEEKEEKPAVSYPPDLEALMREAFDAYVKANPGLSITFEEYIIGSPVIERIKQEYQAQKQEATPAPQETAGTFTPTTPYGEPTGPEVVTQTPTAPVTQPATTERDEFIKTIWPFFETAKERQEKGEDDILEKNILEDPLSYAKQNVDKWKRQISIYKKELEEEKEKEKQDIIKLNIRYAQDAFDSFSKIVTAIEEYDASQKTTPTAATTSTAEVFQGYDTLEEREFNYFAKDEKEAKDYGKNVRKVVVDLTGSLNTVKDKETYFKLRDEFKRKTGKTFDILINDEEGLKTQAEFFRFLRDEKGYTGLNMLEQSDSVYFVSFGKPTRPTTSVSDKKADIEIVSNGEKLKNQNQIFQSPSGKFGVLSAKDNKTIIFFDTLEQALEGAYIERRRQEELDKTNLYEYDRKFKEFQTYGNTVKEAFDNLFEQAKNNPTNKELNDLLDYINERLVSEDIQKGSGKNPLVQEYIDENQQSIEKASKSTKSRIGKINATYDRQLAALEGKPTTPEVAPVESVVIEETTGVNKAIAILNSATSLKDLPNAKFTDNSPLTNKLLDLVGNGEITSDDLKALIEAKRDQLNSELTANDLPLKSLITFKDGSKAFVNYKKGNNITLKVIGTKAGITEVRTMDQIKGNVFMIEEKKEIPVEKQEPTEIPPADKQEVEASKDTLKTFTDDAAKVKEISNEIEKSDSTENPNEDDFFDQLGCKT